MSAGAFDDRDSILGGSSSRNGDAVIEMDTLPPRWLDIQDQVAELLADIAGRTKRLEGLHSKHVLPGFDDEAVKAKEEQEIEALTRDITRSFQQCQRAIARVDGLLKEEQVRGQLGDGEEKMARNLKIALATRVQEASTQFRKKQSAYLRSMYTPTFGCCFGYLVWSNLLRFETASQRDQDGKKCIGYYGKIIRLTRYLLNRTPLDEWPTIVTTSCGFHNLDPKSLRGPVFARFRSRPVLFAINNPAIARAAAGAKTQAEC